MIKDELKAEPGCADARIGLTKGDLQGSNWTVFMVRSGPKVSPCLRRAEEIGRRLAARYNRASD